MDMMRWGVTLTGLLLTAGPLMACSMCGGNILQRTTLRQEGTLPQARLIVIGTAQSSTIDSTTGRGSTKFAISTVLKDDKALGERKVIELPQYMPVNAREPAQFLIFCDVFRGQLDPYRGVVITGPKAIEYVRKTLALDPRDRSAALLFYAQHFEDPDREVAADAFLEFAKAADADIGAVASKLDAGRLRRALTAPGTPPERLSVYAALLGACGTAEDAAYLARCLDDTRNERIINAYDGFLGGYISLRPAEGWKRAEAVLGDKQQPLPLRLSVLRTLRFQMGAHAERRTDVLRCSDAVLREGDLADIAVEDLRRWKVWDRTPQILGLYQRPDGSPVLKEAIVRFAVQAAEEKQPQALAFVAERERLEPDLVREVRQSLQYQPK
jgi:hypothetical protein